MRTFTISYVLLLLFFLPIVDNTMTINTTMTVTSIFLCIIIGIPIISSVVVAAVVFIKHSTAIIVIVVRTCHLALLGGAPGSSCTVDPPAVEFLPKP